MEEMITLHLNLDNLCLLIDKAGGLYSVTVEGEMYKVRIEFPNKHSTTILLHKHGGMHLSVPLENYNTLVDVLPGIRQYANDYTFSESLPAAADVYSTKEEFTKEKLQMDTKEIDKEAKEERAVPILEENILEVQLDSGHTMKVFSTQEWAKKYRDEKIKCITTIPPFPPVANLKLPTLKSASSQAAKSDPGAHYRFTYQGLKLDPARIGAIYGITHPMQFQALKKLLCTGNRGHKSLLQDIADIECCLQRWKEMLQEDETSEN